MGVQLNIKSAEARRLAEQLAEESGESITRAVTEALRLRLGSLRRTRALASDSLRDREREFYALIGGSRARWRDALLSADHSDLLYDNRGMPR